MKCSGLLLVIFTLFQYSLYSQNKIGPWELKKLFKTPAWEKTDLAPREGMTGLLYDALPVNSKRVQVFAYYSTPKGEAPQGGWPAVVCVHGGGGTALNEWVKKWNEHGYAAISMDLEGHLPLNKSKNRKDGRLPTPNPGLSRVGVFQDFNKPIEQQWYYHAVAQIILAHSLIRSFPEINAEKTGITGVSWGGNLTSTTMGVDARFKFAIPGYGCGFLVGSSGHQGRAIKKGKHWDTVAQLYDGSAYFKNVKMPTFWVNGTNDFHFAMPATQKSSRAVQGKVSVRYQLEMAHGHQPVWNTRECYAFADSIIKGKTPLLKVFKPQVKGRTLSAEVEGELSEVKILYTMDSDKTWPDRKWQSREAIVSHKIIAGEIPSGATAAFLNVTDKNGMMVSSEFVEIK